MLCSSPIARSRRRFASVSVSIAVTSAAIFAFCSSVAAAPARRSSLLIARSASLAPTRPSSRSSSAIQLDDGLFLPRTVADAGGALRTACLDHGLPLDLGFRLVFDPSNRRHRSCGRLAGNIECLPNTIIGNGRPSDELALLCARRRSSAASSRLIFISLTVRVASAMRRVAQSVTPSAWSIA